MKIAVIAKLKNTSHETMREGLDCFAKNGVSKGVEHFWLSADGRTMVLVAELDDINETHRLNYLYGPYFESFEQHIMLDASEGIPNLAAALELV